MNYIRPQKSPTKNIQEIYYNRKIKINPYYATILSIMITINFAYLLKYFNFNNC
jgi:hypothetical protein